MSPNTYPSLFCSASPRELARPYNCDPLLSLGIGIQHGTLPDASLFVWSLYRDEQGKVAHMIPCDPMVDPGSTAHSHCLPRRVCWRHLKTNRWTTTHLPLLQIFIRHHTTTFYCSASGIAGLLLQCRLILLWPQVFFFYHETITILLRIEKNCKSEEFWMVARIWNPCDGGSLRSQKRLE